MKPIFVGLGVVTLGTASLCAYRWHDGQLAELRREIAAVRDGQREARPQEVQTLVSYIEQVPAAAPLAARATAVVGVEPPGAARTASEAAANSAKWEEEARANEADIQSNFVAQTVDGSWGPRTGRDLRGRLSALLPSSSSMGDVDCRSSVCRVEVVHRDAEAAEHFAQRAFTDVNDRAWDGPSYLMPPEAGGDGTFKVVMYLGREGTSLLPAP
jgi:hypothetical protein